jgi:Lon-like protease
VTDQPGPPPDPAADPIPHPVPDGPGPSRRGPENLGYANPGLDPLGFEGPVFDTRPDPPEARSMVMLVAGFSAVLIAVLATFLPVHYVVLHPGPVRNTLGQDSGKSLIAISGHATYPTSGQLDLTTVSVAGGPDRRLSLLEVMTGWLDHRTAVVPEEDLFAPGQTQQQNDAENKAEMVSSQESATAAALSTLGIDVPTTLTVAGVEKSAPAAGVLLDGDVLRTIDGTTISDLDVLRTTLQATRPGGTVTVGVTRKGKARDLRVGTIASPVDGHTVLGVYIDPTFRFPFSVKIQIEDIGGPSAGMMFALGIIDKLTPGALTGGRRIAGTGTIDADGTVGPIGGIRQKLVGARQAGARYFLAPADNCAEVRGHVPAGLQVVRVATLDAARGDVTAIAAGRAKGLAGC